MHRGTGNSLITTNHQSQRGSKIFCFDAQIRSAVTIDFNAKLRLIQLQRDIGIGQCRDFDDFFAAFLRTRLAFPVPVRE